jgi:hypothetical protein
MRNKAYFVMVLVFLCAASEGLSQSSTLSQQNQDSQKANTQLALRVATETLELASQLQSPTNRIKIRSTAAALLSNLAPEKASKAYADIAADFRGMESAFASDEGRMREAAVALRAEVVRQLSEHNPSQALDFLRSTSSFTSQELDAADSEAHLNLFVAGRMVSVDPRRAYALVINNLPKKVCALIPELILSLRVKDDQLARELTVALLNKLLSSDLAGDSDAFLGAVNLLQADTPRPDIISGRVASRQSPRLLMEQKRVELFKRLYSAALTPTGKSQDRPRQLDAANLQINEPAPNSTAALNTYVHSVENTQTKTERLLTAYQEQIANRPINEVLNALLEAPKDLTDSLYQQAAWKVASSGDLATAEQILGNIEDPGERRSLLDQLFSEEVSAAAARGDKRRVREMLARVSSSETRMRLLIEAANICRAGGRSEMATTMLEEAASQLSSRAMNATQQALRLQMACAFAQLGMSERAEQILTPEVQQLSDVVEAGMRIGGFMKETDVYENGELSLESDGVISRLYYNCAEALSTLASTDPSRALAAADLFFHLETKLMARLYVAKGALSNVDQQDISEKNLD